MTLDTLKTILGYLTAIVTAIAGTLGAQHVLPAPQKPAQAQMPSAPTVAAICAVELLEPRLKALEGQAGQTHEMLQAWIANERQRQAAEAQAWLAARARAAAK